MLSSSLYNLTPTLPLSVSVCVVRKGDMVVTKEYCNTDLLVPKRVNLIKVYLHIWGVLFPFFFLIGCIWIWGRIWISFREHLELGLQFNQSTSLPSIHAGHGGGDLPLQLTNLPSKFFVFQLLINKIGFTAKISGHQTFV